MKSQPTIEPKDSERVRWILVRLERLELTARASKVCAVHDVPLDLAVSRNRHKSIAAARKALYAWLQGLGYSFPEIAGILDVDHTTVMGGVGALRRKPKAPPKRITAIASIVPASCDGAAA